MYQLSARNVNDAFIEALALMRTIGSVESSRNGLVRVAQTPIMTEYQRPMERVLFNHARDANPFFHLAECIWMMAGSNDLNWLAQFNSNMARYSDDNIHLRGAYGHRWRKWFTVDQLPKIIQELTNNPDSRRAVLAMWDPASDLGGDYKDIPCNTHIYFRINQGVLEMTVCCRSNDIVWGAYGANAVHFSFLHEFLARALARPQGRMYQFSNNWHVYQQHWKWVELPPEDHTRHYYRTAPVIPLFTGQAEARPFLADCENMVADNPPYETYFMREVVAPMIQFYRERKLGHIEKNYLLDMPDCDWKTAAIEWLGRRIQQADKEFGQPHHGHGRADDDDAERPGRGYIDQG